jgi:polysaccharide export outer membrane protein
VLDIRIFNRPQLSREAVRVDRRGTIRMPLIEGEVQAACRTERELADEISTRYLKFIKAPQVDVFVREFNSQPVAVIGAVNSPGRFQLQRPVRLLELLTFANGPAERAGRSIQVIHAADSPVCEAPTSASEDALKTGLVSFSLISTLQGREPSNPFVQPGDIITIPEAEQAFIVGNVLRPTAIPLKEPTSISRAVAFAGGTMPDTKNDGVRIIRQLPGSATKTEIHVDLKAIEKRQAEDVLLQANDIVDVPTSGGKRFMRTLLSTIAPAAGQLPVQVIRR